MTANPHLQLYVACGYYDLATPHFAMQYTLNHLGLDPALESNVTVSHFEGGHMMYIFEPAMVQLRSELLDWYQRAMGEP
jgi:carboxypeptidase C (cathepsin A)